ncbi:MAG: hypothetical protein RL017_168, partial [Pseudomonadota bacterium]
IIKLTTMYKVIIIEIACSKLYLGEANNIHNGFNY